MPKQVCIDTLILDWRQGLSSLMVQRWVVVRSVWVVVEPTVWWVTSVGCGAPAGVPVCTL